MERNDILQALGDYWPRLRSRLDSSESFAKDWDDAFLVYEASEFRAACRGFAAANSGKAPSIQDLRNLLAPKRTLHPENSSPVTRERRCPTCETRLREWEHADAPGGPKWRDLGDGGFLFQKRDDGWYAVRCPACKGPRLFRSGMNALPQAREPAAWLPMSQTPLKAWMADIYGGKTSRVEAVSSSLFRAMNRTRAAFVAQERAKA